MANSTLQPLREPSDPDQWISLTGHRSHKTVHLYSHALSPPHAHHKHWPIVKPDPFAFAALPAQG